VGLALKFIVADVEYLANLLHAAMIEGLLVNFRVVPDEEQRHRPGAILDHSMTKFLSQGLA
jgi:hypothetical protein